MDIVVDPKKIAKVVAPFESTEPMPGLVKSLGYLSVVGALSFYSFQVEVGIMYYLLLFFTGLIYGGMLVLTHDAIHQTCTGWKWYDELFARVISWPVGWIHGTYSEVHKLHHKMNGTQLADPERVQFTTTEYEQASPLFRFYIRNQWYFNIFLFAGLGLIYRTLRAGIGYAKVSAGMRRAILTDIVMIFAVHFLAYYFYSGADFALRFWSMFFVYQYVAGLVLQLRAHIEHYGLWGKGSHFYDSQVWNCRNVRTYPLVSWYFNYLNYHSIHHAFPRVPFYKLIVAQKAIAKLYKEAGSELPVTQGGYLTNAYKMAKSPSLIDASKTHLVTFGKNVVPLESFR